MRESMLLEYPPDEYRRRLDGLFAGMETAGFDAVVLTSRENTRYFCGLQSVSWKSKSAAPGLLVATGQDGLVLAGSASARGTMEATSCVEDIRGFHPKRKGGMPAGLSELVAGILAERGCASGRIGMEFGERSRLNMPMACFRDLERRCPDAVFEDCGPVVWPLRIVKSVRELEAIRTACRINCLAFEKALKGIREGTTEREVYSEAVREMLRLGAHEVYTFGVRAGKDRYGQPNCTPSDRPIGRNEMILMDGGLIYRGFYTDIIRQAIVGEPTDTQRRWYEASVGACEAALGRVKPGARVGGVCAGANEYLRSIGLSGHEVVGCGHGLGLDIHEFPRLECDEDEPLVPGMVLAVEPAIYVPGEGMFGIEENIVVTDSGYELLTPMSRELIVLE